ncbi:MAG: VIT1/CCC1 transporter family protein [Chlamydiales bacterium]|nr:VIT1/CCC1 transporter family protein [Chlamydiales bacterium]
MEKPAEYSHFAGKDPLQHILETKAKNTACEPHSAELASHIFAATDTARYISLLIVLLYTICAYLQIGFQTTLTILALFSLGTLIGYCGRCAWIGWAHLERLHRSLKQEHYEIEHHRNQEREELRALYSKKGFQGPLLEQVVDVLMADEERLLKIMLEEEMGLSLGTHEHPLKQAFGAFIGGSIAIGLSALSLFFLPPLSLIFTTFIIMGAAALFAAYYENNRMISACIWSLGIAALALSIVYFVLKIVHPQ